MEILQIFSAPAVASAQDPSSLGRKLQLKFFMMIALGELQQQILPAERDPEWTESAQSGQFAQSVDAAFTIAASSLDSDLAMAEDLKAMMTLVSARWCH